MVHELSVAFPEMPPIRDFCAVGMMAPTALQDVKSLYDGQPSAAAAILKRSAIADRHDVGSKGIVGHIIKFLIGKVRHIKKNQSINCHHGSITHCLFLVLVSFIYSLGNPTVPLVFD